MSYAAVDSSLSLSYLNSFQLESTSRKILRLSAVFLSAEYKKVIKSPNHSCRCSSALIANEDPHTCDSRLHIVVLVIGQLTLDVED